MFRSARDRSAFRLTLPVTTFTTLSRWIRFRPRRPRYSCIISSTAKETLTHPDMSGYPVCPPRLPMRLENRVVDSEEACYGWGIHIIEGPNREVIFWLIIATIASSVLASILWSSLQGDLQGGMSLGALIIALPPAVLGAFLFRLQGI
jgi:hypothetical protein